MTIERAKPNLRTTYRVKPLLAAIGLPRNARWPAAAERIRTLMVAARRSNDDDTASELSAVKSFLRRNLLNECACGSVINAGSVRCLPCERRK